MKLGEALSLRAQQAGQLNDLRGRVSTNAVTQEGANAQEEPKQLLDEYEALSTAHTELVERINRTNVETGLINDLQRREHLRRLRNTWDMAADAVRSGVGGGSLRYMRSELRMVPQMQVSELQKRVDELTEEIRVLDVQVQGKNWQIDLVDLP